MKKIKFDDLTVWTALMIVIGFIMGIWLLSFTIFWIIPNIDRLNEEMKDVPHIVCVNETTLSYVRGNNILIETNAKENYDKIYCTQINYVNADITNHYECKSIKEVCKLVDAEGNEIETDFIYHNGTTFKKMGMN